MDIKCQWLRPYFCIISLPWRVILRLALSSQTAAVPAHTDSLLSSLARRGRHPLGQEAQAAARAGTRGMALAPKYGVFVTFAPAGEPLTQKNIPPVISFLAGLSTLN